MPYRPNNLCTKLDSSNSFPFLGTGSKTQFPIFRKGNSTLLFSRTSEKNQLTSKYTFNVSSLLSRRRPPCSRHRPSMVEVSALPWKSTTSGTGSRYPWECMGTRIPAHPFSLFSTERGKNLLTVLTLGQGTLRSPD